MKRHTSLPQAAPTDGDLLPVVDARDRVVGLLTRREIHDRNLRHRSVQVAIFAPDGRLWIQRRAWSKDTFPNHWDLTATGHVDPGETYEQAARREIAEELRIDARPEPVARLAASARTGWEFQHLFELRRWEGGFEFNRDEISAMRLISLDELSLTIVNPRPDLPLTPGFALWLPWLTGQIQTGSRGSRNR